MFPATDTKSVIARSTDIATLPGMTALWAESLGDPRICVAILDGAVDQSHPCFAGANLTRLSTLVSDDAGNGQMAGHGTHIASVIFGQHNGSVQGIAPSCRGLILPIFSDRRRGPLSQLDLARAINQAVEQGAHVINISGGELAELGEAQTVLADAVRFCNETGALIVAAAGNDACECLHVPAALPSVLAVGALNSQGLPFDFSNWGSIYQSQGILAPGEHILGAVPGGGTTLKSGTSFATPIVAGVVALLLSAQLQRGEEPNPHAIRDAILKSALPCNPEMMDCRRFLAGSLNIPGASALLSKGGIKAVSEQTSALEIAQPNASAPIVGLGTATNQHETNEMGMKASTHQLPTTEVNNAHPGHEVEEAISLGFPADVDGLAAWAHRLQDLHSRLMEHRGVQAAAAPSPAPIPTSKQTSSHSMDTSLNMTTMSDQDGILPSVASSEVVASEGCGCDGSTSTALVYALGTLGYDFGTEARRDSFIQLMPQDPGAPPPNPYVAAQMIGYLQDNPWEAKSLIWTLNIELTPIYAIEPAGPYADEVYRRLREFLSGQIQDVNDPDFVARVSIPGVLTGKSVALFSGQVVPVVMPQVRGMYSWNVNQLVNAATQAARVTGNQAENMRGSLREFLNRVYYEFRNLGATSHDRALNFAATNAFQAAQVWSEASSGGMQLDVIDVERSPFCRMDSDCWDVKLKFFDPENDRRARKVYRYTIDVSDAMPVTIGDVRSWSVSS